MVWGLSLRPNAGQVTAETPEAEAAYHDSFTHHLEELVQCEACHGFLNPFTVFHTARKWQCNLCGFDNELPSTASLDLLERCSPHLNPLITAVPLQQMPALFMFVLDVRMTPQHLDLIEQQMLQQLRALPKAVYQSARVAVLFPGNRASLVTTADATPQLVHLRWKPSCVVLGTGKGKGIGAAAEDATCPTRAVSLYRALQRQGIGIAADAFVRAKPLSATYPAVAADSDQDSWLGSGLQCAVSAVAALKSQGAVSFATISLFYCGGATHGIGSGVNSSAPPDLTLDEQQYPLSPDWRCLGAASAVEGIAIHATALTSAGNDPRCRDIAHATLPSCGDFRVCHSCDDEGSDIAEAMAAAMNCHSHWDVQVGLHHSPGLALKIWKQNPAAMAAAQRHQKSATGTDGSGGGGSLFSRMLRWGKAMLRRNSDSAPPLQRSAAAAPTAEASKPLQTLHSAAATTAWLGPGTAAAAWNILPKGAAAVVGPWMGRSSGSAAPRRYQFPGVYRPQCLGMAAPSHALAAVLQLKPPGTALEAFSLPKVTYVQCFSLHSALEEVRIRGKTGGGAAVEGFRPCGSGAAEVGGSGGESSEGSDGEGSGVWEVWVCRRLSITTLAIATTPLPSMLMDRTLPGVTALVLLRQVLCAAESQGLAEARALLMDWLRRLHAAYSHVVLSGPWPAAYGIDAYSVESDEEEEGYGGSEGRDKTKDAIFPAFPALEDLSFALFGALQGPLLDATSAIGMETSSDVSGAAAKPRGGGGSFLPRRVGAADAVATLFPSFCVWRWEERQWVLLRHSLPLSLTTLQALPDFDGGLVSLDTGFRMLCYPLATVEAAGGYPPQPRHQRSFATPIAFSNKANFLAAARQHFIEDGEGTPAEGSIEATIEPHAALKAFHQAIAVH